jgi:hypothetical protein
MFDCFDTDAFPSIKIYFVINRLYS